MKVTHEFLVSQSPDDVWEFFQDISSVAGCLPGAELTGTDYEGGYQGRLSVKLGPMTSAFEGTAKISPDPESKSATIEGTGVDKRGGSRGRVTVRYSLEPEHTGTIVTVDADITLSGPAAQFGRTGLINEMSKKLIGEFVDCLERKLRAVSPDEAEAITAEGINGVALFFSSLWAWLKRLFGRVEE